MGDKQPQPFDAVTVALKGTNLIEASAGTGKTYSIAILALRLVLEQDIALEQILMVTFTRAAVAELHERVRLFLKMAHRFANGGEISDETISGLVMWAMEQQDAETVRKRLYHAVLLLDELSVITIHSFCQQTLTEFAFETRQLFGAEMFTELEEVIAEEVNQFWRRYITTLEVEVLQLLDMEHLRLSLNAVVRDHLEGKRYAPYREDTIYRPHHISLDAQEAFRNTLQQDARDCEYEVLEAFESYREAIEAACNSSRSPKKKEFLGSLHSAQAFLQLLQNTKPNVLTAAFPSGFMEIYERARQQIENAAAQVERFLPERINCLAIQEVSANVKAFLLRNNLLGYNDLIHNLHRALTDAPNPALEKALQNKYKAVFVDEFQDTDKEQYEIFRTAFFSGTLLFLIGDPKQSIYAWRKADIHTYFKARNDVDNLYEMNVNFRSSAPMIAAMNRFFLPQPGFDTFAFPEGTDRITYTPVESPAGNAKGLLLFGGEPDVPLSVFEAPKKETLIQEAAVQVQALLSGDAYRIRKGDTFRKIVPSDIGILVRKHSEADGIRHYLSQMGIPTVMVNDERILESEEARELLFLLEAIFEPALPAIHKALLNTITGFTISDILKLDEEKILYHFQLYKNTWQRNGIYPALQQFLKDFGLKERLIGNHEIQGERILSNLVQLIELLNQTVHYGELSQEDLLAWFRRGVNGTAVKGDEYITRMESDEDAVKIVTIHKSKGLEYNIVLAPFLDMNASNKFEFQRFRDAEGNYLVRETVMMSAAETAMNLTQLEQENRRLIYVAVTRAVYKCFLFENKAGYYSKSSLKPFLEAIAGDEEMIRKGAMPVYDLAPYQVREAVQDSAALVASGFKLVNENWAKLSYTAMAVHPAKGYKERTDQMEDEYDRFIFNQLRFGAAAGNLLHQVLEQIDFSSDRNWTLHIENALKAYMPSRMEAFAPQLHRLLTHVVQVPLSVGGAAFRLRDVPPGKRLAEMEFDFPIKSFQAKPLEQAIQTYSNVWIRSFEGIQLDGLMNGKIDLFFEHGGRFYILDWKSNYLGYKPEDYDTAGVRNAMDENNYHLQYLLYAVALKKYISARMPSFDYEQHFGGVIYLFLRGIRSDSTHGVFTARPPRELIDSIEMILGRES